MSRAVLIYRRTCRKCRILSVCAVLLGWGWIRRLPHDSPEVARLGHPCFERGRLKLTLLIGSRRIRGAAVLLGVPLAPVLVFLRPASRS
jgi:hypothetical protein